MVTDRRASLRVPLSVNVTCTVNRQERVEKYKVKSVNISDGGIFLQTNLPLGIGTKVELAFLLPGREDSLRCRGDVVWFGGTKKRGEGAKLGKGIKFRELDDRIRKQLIEYIQQSS